MGNQLIVITGAISLVRRVVVGDNNLQHLKYYRRLIRDFIKDDLSDIHFSDSCVKDLYQKEFKRDKKILKDYENQNPAAFVEEWHLGNLAWANALGYGVQSKKYENKLTGILDSYNKSDTSIQVWHVVEDVENPSNDILIAYQRYLCEVVGLCNKYHIPLITLEDIEDTHMIKLRISYILNFDFSK